jgi:hypothetical protein
MYLSKANKYVPIGRKFAQSGHPGWHILSPVKKMLLAKSLFVGCTSEKLGRF